MTMYRDRFKPGPFHLGPFSAVINGVAIAWVVFVIILFCVPQVRQDRLCVHAQGPLVVCPVECVGPHAAVACCCPFAGRICPTTPCARRPTHHCQVVPVNYANLNYAPIAVGITLLIALGWWFVNARTWFKGPKQGWDPADAVLPTKGACVVGA